MQLKSFFSIALAVGMLSTTASATANADDGTVPQQSEGVARSSAAVDNGALLAFERFYNADGTPGGSIVPGSVFYFQFSATNTSNRPVVLEDIVSKVWTATNPNHAAGLPSDYCDQWIERKDSGAQRQKFPVEVAPGQTITGILDNATYTFQAQAPNECRGMQLYFNAGAKMKQTDPQWKRLGGQDRFETAVRVSQEHFPGGAKSVVLARYDVAADALSAAPLAVQKNAPVLLTQTARLSPVTKAEIKRLKPERVYIAGGAGAVSNGVANEIRDLGYRVTRLGGQDRYETSIRIAEHGWGQSGSDSVFIATGRDFPDALSASAAAGANNAPVLLVDGLARSIRADVRGQLLELDPKNINIAGGTGVVTAQVANGLSSYGTVKRFAGATRYETSAAIGKQWHTANGTVYLATGANFADALAGAAVAGSKKAPVLLSRQNCIPDAVHSLITGTIKPQMGYVLGGTGVLTDRVLNQRPSCY